MTTSSSASYLIPVHCRASIRADVIENVHYMCISDLIMHFGHYETAQALGVWQKISKSSLQGNWMVHNDQPMITLAGALILMPMIPGSTCESVANLAAILTHRITKTECSKAETTAVIPFDEIVPGATVRLAVIDGTQYLSVRDVIMHVCGKNTNDTAEVWRNLSDSKKSEVKDSVLIFKFSGRGQQEQPVITFPGALKLIMFLPGEVAKKHRSAMVSILTRYFAGDASLLKEIEVNAASESPIHQMAREALKGPEMIEDAKKRKHEEIESEIRSLNCENQVTVIDKYNAMCDRQSTIIANYKAVCLDDTFDDHAKQVFKQMLLWSAGMK